MAAAKKSSEQDSHSEGVGGSELAVFQFSYFSQRLGKAIAFLSDMDY